MYCVLQMWHRLLVVTVALTCVCVLVEAQSEVFQVTEKRNARYCGRFLADILSQMCKGMYNTKFHKKSYGEFIKFRFIVNKHVYRLAQIVDIILQELVIFEHHSQIHSPHYFPTVFNFPSYPTTASMSYFMNM